MDLDLHQKHILITGGSKGIGLACAKAFLSEGASVTLISRSQDNLDQAREILIQDGFEAARIHLHAADLTQAANAAKALEHACHTAGEVDVLVNSAGAASRIPAFELTPEDWQDAMNAKFFSYINIANPALKRMAQRGHGNLVNIVGIGGKVASAVHVAGGAANAALLLATAGLAAAYGPKGVRVTAVNPGRTLTDRMQGLLEAEASQNHISLEEATHRAGAKMPLGRVAQASEIANAVVFLASGRASYISGAILTVDGALTAII
jgi:NAD(P)-dependent dehydrogenase (short-subunit alcohol dehydrogenase family)